MMLPVGVLTIYAALAVWAALLLRGFQKRAFRLPIIFGVALMLWLNAGYLINGVPASIAAFVGIYDVLINVGLTSASDAAAVTTCPGNACTVWGERFVNHPSWGTAFYDRFANGPEFRSLLLYGHIVFNSIVFVLMHVQLFRPGYGETQTNHRLLGRISFACLTISLFCAVWLASEHGAVPEYGGLAAQFGFYSMAAFVYGTAIAGIAAIRAGDADKHRIWMFRFIGAMWGSFWLFRIVLFVIDPILRDFESAAILIVIWGSAPAGILIAEMVRRRMDTSAAQKPETVAAE